MSTVQLHCPRCAGLFQIDSSLAGRQVVCPLCGNLVAIPATFGPEAASPGYGAPQTPTVETRDPAPLPTEEGGFPMVREPTETVDTGEEEELHGLTPKEKRRRRLVTNLIWAILGVLVLIATAAVMISLSD